MRAKLPAIVVEKDLWVTLVLQLVFKLPFADRIIFKGGSSLSKCWDLIGRKYVRPVVMLEISSRSLIEPTRKTKVSSMVSQTFPDMSTDVTDAEIRAALPEKTFLENVFLLHEIFTTDRCQKAERKSRHL